MQDSGQLNIGFYRKTSNFLFCLRGIEQKAITQDKSSFREGVQSTIITTAFRCMKNLLKQLLKILKNAFVSDNAQVRVNPNNHPLPVSPSTENQTLATVSTLIVTLSHSDLRYHAIVALGNLGKKAAIAVPALIDLLDNEDAVIRVTAIEALCKIGSAIETVPALVRVLRDESVYVRAHAAFGLGCFREKAIFAVDALIAALKDDDEWVRGNAADAIARIGKSAHHATSALIDALGDRNPKVRAKATLALATVATDTDILPSLISTANDQDSRVRAAVAEAFGCVLGCTCSDCVIALTLSLNDPDVYVRISAAKSLVKIGKQIPVSIDVLMQILTTSDTQILTTTILNFGIIGAYLQQHIPSLSAAEISQLIDNFQRTLEVITSQNLQISEFAIASIQETLKRLQKGNRE